MTVDVAASAAVTPAIARAFIEQARHKNYAHGVIGVRARPEATRETTFQFGGQSVRIVPAGSALALREAIRSADRDGWLVVVTDRSDDDLGAGLLSHLIWQRLRHPDPWQAVQQAFAAHSVDARLLSLGNARDVASGYECGMTFTNFTDFNEGDTVEAFANREVKRTIDDLKNLAAKTAPSA